MKKYQSRLEQGTDQEFSFEEHHKGDWYGSKTKSFEEAVREYIYDMKEVKREMMDTLAIRGCRVVWKL